MKSIFINPNGPCICGACELRAVEDLSIIYTAVGEKWFLVCERCRRIYDAECRDLPIQDDVLASGDYSEIRTQEEPHELRLRGRALLNTSQWRELKRKIATLLFVRP